MKENAQRLLSWLYPPQKTSRWVATEELSLVAPDLTSGGLQSVLAYLQQEKRIVLERVEGAAAASITSHGMRALEGEIPVFSPARREWKGEWQGVFFLEAPKQDKNFRFLRRLLLSAHAIPISRGMFLYPGRLPERLSFELNEAYEGSVLVASLKDWLFGDEREIIGSVLQLGDLTDTYSSISKEIDSLLTLDSPLILLSDQSKLRFSSVFDRLYSALKHDYGLQQAYFPRVESGVDLLFELQSISAMG